MIIDDATGIVLVPGDGGDFCPGNGRQKNKDGRLIECCCNECDYLLCCLDDHDSEDCKTCTDPNCPNTPENMEKEREEIDILDVTF